MVKKLRLAVLPGDGIGQEVTLAAIPVFEALRIPTEISFGEIGWLCWKKEGNTVPDRTWELIKSSDATLLGATTSKPEREASKELPISLQASPPQYVSPIIQLRQRLDLYANVRPCFNIKGEGKDFNFSVIRENTEGLYSGFDFHPLTDSLVSILSENSRWNKISKNDVACSLRLQSRLGLTRLFEFAFKYAEKEKFSRVTFADKPNVLRKSSAFARDIFEMIADKYPHIKADIHNVDAVALWMVKRPSEFGVIVAENMFGDILSDLGAGVMGGLGFAASANIGERGCYFEPVHGSAPRIKSSCANPSAMFLTISLLLENFGFTVEANRIKKAIKAVIREARYLTYDLGGGVSTQVMAQAIIDNCFELKEKKKISFLATGSEIIQGDVQDNNSHYFSKIITQKGGDIYQHIQSSDKKIEITSALKYLLDKSEAVVVTGGLGPTSDDVTRFAVADVVEGELYFEESAWNHVVKRLESFNLSVTESNRQQALFPLGVELYPNEQGTAFGCHLKWQNKHIFMLPGPPKECCPLFEKHVMPTLIENDFFRRKKAYKWLTLGLVEGEIASEVDELAKNHLVEVAYRWNYPYLEIKLVCDENEDVETLIKKIEDRVAPYLVSNHGKNAVEMLVEKLQMVAGVICVVDKVTGGQFLNEIAHPKLLAPSSDVGNNQKNSAYEISFVASSSHDLENQTDFSGMISIECEGMVKNQKIYMHKIVIPNRGPEVMEYARCYLAWQLSRFVEEWD